MIPPQLTSLNSMKQSRKLSRLVSKLQLIKHSLLAGKFKDAEALEQAYLELQSKLGEPREEPEAEPVEEEAQEDLQEEPEDGTLTESEAKATAGFSRW